MTADPGADIAIAEAAETDYSQWRASVSSHQVGTLVVAPPWLAHKAMHEGVTTAEAIAQATLATLAREGKLDVQRAQAAIAELGFDSESPDPVTQ